MSFKQTGLYSIINNKCPRCHEGAFFENNNPYKLRKFDKMNNECPVCSQKFEPEIGFYYGAMYVSYGLTVLFGIGLFSIIVGLLNLDTITFIITFAILQILLMPVFYRISRLAYINIFVKYTEFKK